MTTVKSAARQAHKSDAAQWGARAGLVARGLLWMTVGILATRVALGQGAKADQGGALQALRDQPFGQLLLVVLALSFAAHACFRLLEGLVGRRDEESDRKKLLKRAWSLCRVVIYGLLAASTVRFLLEGSKDEDASGKTAAFMELPAGRTLVGLIGAGLVIGGIAQSVRGLRHDFTKKLTMPGGRMCLFVKRSGAAGLTGRGLVYILLGSFLVEASVTFDADKAKGLDEGLKTLADQPYGTVLLLVFAVGLLAFALWSFLEARYRDF